MAFISSTTAGAASDTPSVAVPAGVQAGDIVILTVAQEAAAAADFTGKYPSGFAALNAVTITADGQGGAVAWKRLTATDSGSYTFATLVNGTDWVCQAFAFRGRNPVITPVSSQNIQNTGQSSPVTITATTLTAEPGDDLIWISMPDVSGTGNGNGHTPPPGFTERQDAEQGWTNLSGATLDSAPGGLTGSVSGSFLLTAGVAGWAGFLVRMPAAAGYRGFFLDRRFRY